MLDKIIQKWSIKASHPQLTLDNTKHMKTAATTHHLSPVMW